MGVLYATSAFGFSCWWFENGMELGALRLQEVAHHGVILLALFGGNQIECFSAEEDPRKVE